MPVHPREAAPAPAHPAPPPPSPKPCSWRLAALARPSSGPSALTSSPGCKKQGPPPGGRGWGHRKGTEAPVRLATDPFRKGPWWGGRGGPGRGRALAEAHGGLPQPAHPPPTAEGWPTHRPTDTEAGGPRGPSLAEKPLGLGPKRGQGRKSAPSLLGRASGRGGAPHTPLWPLYAAWLSGDV